MIPNLALNCEWSARHVQQTRLFAGHYFMLFFIDADRSVLLHFILPR